ncbi:MAG: nucleotidyl transferase AbiEii/AbiGii toxin family protein [Rikenellaceae bacterium]
MKLHYNTVTDQLRSTLVKLMSAEEFLPFRLVGGTSLSLQLGHRLSVDIDLFTDIKYGSLNFDAIEEYLNREFDYCESSNIGVISFGKSYYIGHSADDCVKLDLFYTDTFIRPAEEVDGLRLATIEEIAAMKVDVISRGGRKKDFWDIDQILQHYSIDELLSLHQERYPYTHEREEIIKKFTDFSVADVDFDPVCLLSKMWELIKLDMVERINLFLS